MSHATRLGVFCALGAGFLTGGCALVFLPPFGQHLDLSFAIGEALARGESRVIAQFVAQEGIDARRHTLQLSGVLGRPEGEQLPREIQLTATVRDPDNGKVRQKIRLTAAVTPEDRFRVSKRIRRDIDPGSPVEVTAEPFGDDLPAGTRVRLCLDLVGSKGDLRDFVSCAADGAPTSFAEIQDELLTPSCATVGCHDTATAAAGLSLVAAESYDSLVRVPSSQVFGSSSDSG